MQPFHPALAPLASMPTPFKLRAPRIGLRKLTDRDAPALFDLYADPQVMGYWSHAPWTSVDQAYGAIREAGAEYVTGASLHCAIEDSASGILIGSCALYGLNEQHRSAKLGYLLASPYWGQGYATEAITALLGHGFGRLRLNRIAADVHHFNSASAQALRRLGFRYEGRQRAHWMVAGVGCDTDRYAILRSDWDAR